MITPRFASPRRTLGVLTLPLAILVLGGLARGADGPAATAASDALSERQLKAHVEFLASVELGGRGAPEDRRKVSQWIAHRLAEAGAREAPQQCSMVLPFQGEGFEGWNVAAWIPGATEEYVVASAHFDHLGRSAEGIFRGADDNASGVAALLEIARALAAGPRPRRSVLLVAFDLEEADCKGSRAFAAQPPVPLDRCAAFTTADMLGRSLADVVPGLLLVMGEERATALSDAVGRLEVPTGVVVRRLGMDFNALGWSDYVPFEERKIPCLFLTSGACRDYHRPTDTPDKIDGPMLAARGTAYLRLLRGLANAEERPVWVAEPAPRLAEVEAILDLVRAAGAHEAELGIPESARPLRLGFQTLLEGIVRRGTVTPTERTTVRTMALQMFKMTLAAQPK